MEFMELALSRKMTRDFLSDPIPTALLDQLLTAALRSPSAGFSQGVDLLVLTHKSARDRFWEVTSEPAWRFESPASARIMAAPAIIVPLASPRAYIDRYAKDDKRGSSLGGLAQDEWPVPYWLVDAGFVAMSLLFGAADAGLGGLFFQLQGRERELLSAFEIPEEFQPIGAVAVGYPKIGTPQRGSTAPKRRARSEVIHREHW